MRPIPLRLREQIAEDPYFTVCARKNSQCSGRITIEHVWIYQGTQINELWAFLPLCWYHHLGKGIDKRENEKLSLQRATDDELSKYPRRDWAQVRKSLIGYIPKNGVYCYQ